jgi:hypothetical protein
MNLAVYMKVHAHLSLALVGTSIQEQMVS